MCVSHSWAISPTSFKIPTFLLHSHRVLTGIVQSLLAEASHFLLASPTPSAMPHRHRASDVSVLCWCPCGGWHVAGAEQTPFTLCRNSPVLPTSSLGVVHSQGLPGPTQAPTPCGLPPMLPRGALYPEGALSVCSSLALHAASLTVQGQPDFCLQIPLPLPFPHSSEQCITVELSHKLSYWYLTIPSVSIL